MEILDGDPEVKKIFKGDFDGDPYVKEILMEICM